MHRLTLFLAALPPLAAAWAQPVPNPSAYAPVALPAACGSATGPPCARVLPALAAHTVHAGLVLKQAAGIAPLAAICEGQAAVAIVPRDSLVTGACPDRYELAGRPLYPVYAFLVVLAASPLRHLDDFRDEGPNEQTRAIAAIGDAAATFETLRKADPAWQRLVALTASGLDDGLRRLDAGTADGVFAVEPLEADIVDRVLSRTDGKGTKAYRFAGIYPDKSLFRISDGHGHCLYRPVGLDFGGGSPVTTISVDMVAILSRGFRDTRAKGGPTAIEALAAAIDRTRDTVLGQTKSPRDWRPAAGSCQ